MSDREPIQEIETVASGQRSKRDPIVLESWLRCLNEHHLDPAKRQEAYIVPDTQLREHRQQSEELIHIARSGIEDLYRQVNRLHQSRHYSQYLSLQLKARMERIETPVYRLQESHHCR